MEGMNPVAFVFLFALSAASLWILNLGFKYARETRSALRAQVAKEVPSNLLSGFGSLASSSPGGEALGKWIRLEGQVLVCLDNKQQWRLLGSRGSVQCEATVIESTPLRLRVALNAGWWNGYDNNFDTVHVDFEGAHAKRLAAYLNEGRVEKPADRDSREADERATEIFRRITEEECKREDSTINEAILFSCIAGTILGALPAIRLVEWLTTA
jgi:hypothetical protein